MPKFVLILLLLVIGCAMPKKGSRSQKSAQQQPKDKYHGKFMNVFGPKMANASKYCVYQTNPPKNAKFKINVSVKKSGDTSDFRMTPKTPFSNCMASQMKKATYPPPPNGSYSYTTGYGF